MLVKICGITNLEDALLASELGAAALGFIFVRTSPRYIPPAEATVIVEGVRKRFGTASPFFVGVFVNAARQEIEQVQNIVSLECLQFHGDEPPEELLDYNQRVWKAFRVGENFQPQTLTSYTADAWLLDAYDPSLYGGTGKTFNWEKAIEAKKYANIILSGGLKPQNILNAIATVQPYGIDVNSGVETSPGKKDPEKLRHLFSLLTTRKYDL